MRNRILLVGFAIPALVTVACGNSVQVAPDSGSGVTVDAAIPPLQDMDLFYTTPAVDTHSSAMLHGYTFATSTDTPITPAALFTWSPDRTTMLLVGDGTLTTDGPMSLFRLSDRTAIDLDLKGVYARWSPDSRHVLVFTRTGEQLVIDLDGQKHALQSPGGSGSVSAEFTTASSLHLWTTQQDWVCLPDGTQCITVDQGCSVSPDGLLEACPLNPKGVSFRRISSGAEIGSWSDGGVGVWAPNSAHFASLVKGSTLNTTDVWVGTPMAGQAILSGVPQTMSPPIWSPDSNLVAVMSVLGDGSAKLNLRGLVGQGVGGSFTLPERATISWLPNYPEVFVLAYPHHAPDTLSIGGVLTPFTGAGTDPLYLNVVHPFSPSGKRFLYRTMSETFSCSMETNSCQGFVSTGSSTVLLWRQDDTGLVFTSDGALKLLLGDGTLGSRLTPNAIQSAELRWPPPAMTDRNLATNSL